MIVLDQNNSGQSLDLRIGQVMELRLAENPTTGYRWAFLRNGQPYCVVVNDRFDTPGGPPGRGGEHIWRIEGAAAGECDIAMQYSRGFQADSVARSFTLHVNVGP